MKILALELSSGEGSIAWLADDHAKQESVTFPSTRRDSGAFFAGIQRAVKESGAPRIVVVGLGPGSYAGTRIAIAAAVGLAEVSGAELLGFPSICAIPDVSAEYLIVGDARADLFYCAHIVQRQCADGPHLGTLDEIRSRISSFTGAIFATEPIAAFPMAQTASPSAAVLLDLAQRESNRALRAPLEPIYLRGPGVTQPKAGRATTFFTR